MTNSSDCFNATIKLVGITYRRAVIKLVLKSFRRRHSIDWSGSCCFFSLLLCPTGKGNALSLLPGIDFVPIESRNCQHLYGLSRVCGNRDVANLCANWKIASKGVRNRFSIRGNAPQCMTIAICFLVHMVHYVSWRTYRFLLLTLSTKIKS